MKIKKILANIMCASMILSNLTVVSASNVIINETPLDDEGIVSDTGSSETEWTTDESNLADVEVTYTQSSSYFVTIPKTITLDSKKQATYSIKVTGDIDTNQRVYVAPVDVISDTEEVDFYMKDQNSKKDDVVATVTQNKLYWDSEEVASGYEATNNSISAPDLTSGTWKGTFQVEIKLQSETSHEHNFIDGKCDCGEIDSNHTHNYVDGLCDICGKADPNHTHNYVDGTCTICGDQEHIHNYVDGKCDCGEVDPNHTHNYVDDTCTICGEAYDSNHTHDYVDDICTICGEADPNHTHNYENNICTICKELRAGLYDANDNLLVSWEDSGIKTDCSNAYTTITKTYPATTKVVIGDSATSIESSVTSTTKYIGY